MKISTDFLSIFLQSGILITLLGIAYKIGKVESKLTTKVEDHERRIAKLEDYALPDSR